MRAYLVGAYRLGAVFGLVAALLLSTLTPVLAGTTGSISGTVVDQSTRAPLSGVQVTVASPSGTSRTTTDPRGFYSITGLAVDTYVVSFSRQGYELGNVSGVTVIADQQVTVNGTLGRTLTTIGRVTGRSAASAFQPTQTTDTYTVTQNQITTQLGKKNNISESQLLVSLPGASLDSSGYPVLRGGRENEEGFQVEGIDYTDAFTTQFTNSQRLNGIGSFQLTPGAGDASQGNAGTGTINITIRRGTSPAFGSLDFEAVNYPYYHQFSGEYGFATPNGRFSSYTAFTGTREARAGGARYGNQVQIGGFYSTAAVNGNDFVENAVYKFGRDQNQSLQLFSQAEVVGFLLNGYAEQGLFYKTNDPFNYANYYSAYSGLTQAQIQPIIGLDPLQKNITDMVRQSGQYQPVYTTKLQYTNNFNSSTTFSLQYYSESAVTTFDLPYSGQGPGDQLALQGGNRYGFRTDLTKQFNEKNLVKLGAKYEYLRPIDNVNSNDYGFLDLTQTFGAQVNEVYDFLPQSAGGANGCPKGVVQCGYLQQFAGQFGGAVPRVPNVVQISPVNERTLGLYINDTYSPTAKLRFDIGARLDTAGYNFPGSGYQSSATNPSVFEPRGAFSYQLGSNDAIRFSYGRSIELAPLADVEAVVSRAQYNAFNNIPSYSNVTGLPATFCGLNGKTACTSYADQLYWENQNTFDGPPITPIKPETFSNFDASYSHQFRNGIAMKITPFYRRGYDAAVREATFKTDAFGNVLLSPTGVPLQNPAVATNLGINRTTGVEFQATRDIAYGLSGQISATYINELSNVIPTSSREDFFPTIPLASVALGNVYRVAFVSPFQATAALQYKSRGGFRVNPIVTWNRGYPIGNGNIVATFAQGVAANVPNTNVTSTAGAASTSNYVDPQNPGTVYKPNIIATRGTPEGNAAGGTLSYPRFNTNVSFEYSPPSAPKTTYGVLFTNLFNQIYGQPSINTRWQPVATGIGGPQTGLSTLPVVYPNIGYFQYDTAQFGQSPYRLVPNQTPLTARFYFRVDF